MGIRIILVSVVAGLGLTLPSVNQVSEWRTAARGWVNERLAEWDAQMPVDANSFVIVPEPPVVEKAAPVIQTAETTEAQPGQTIAPAVVAKDERIAGLDAPTSPMNLDEAEWEIETPLAPTPAAAPLPDVQIGDSGFVAAQDEFVAGFMIEVVAAETIREADDPENLFPGLAYELNLAAEDLDTLQPVALSGVSHDGLVETVDFVENLYEGLAYELNQKAEGLEPMPISLPRTAQKATLADREGRLTTAVRLTREAVHAWANLFHGPAVVTIGQ